MLAVAEICLRCSFVQYFVDVCVAFEVGVANGILCVLDTDVKVAD